VNEEMRKSLRVPMWCPVCRSIMKGSKSNHTYYDYKCCTHCFIEFVEGREQRWKDGWRPDEKTIEKFSDMLQGNS